MKFFGYDIGRKAEPLSDRGAGDVAINDTSVS